MEAGAPLCLERSPAAGRSKRRQQSGADAARPRPAGGDAQRELEHLEVFCNPNAYSTAFDAKVLVALRTAGGVRVTTEARLSALKSDVDAFVEQLAAA